MALNKAYNQYRENSVYTASPGELTLMLYNGLVKFVMLAYESVDAHNFEKANENIIRAQDIIHEFQVTLNMQYELSNSLMLLYDYLYRRLIEANVKKDKEILEEVLYFAKELRNTWEQALKITKKPQPKIQKAVE